MMTDYIDLRCVMLAHPVSGDVIANVARAKRWLAWACRDRSVAAHAPWIAYVELFAGTADDDLAARELNLRRSELHATRANELWLVGGIVTAGMMREIAAAERSLTSVYDLTRLGYEPPEEHPRQVVTELVRWAA